jgi:hypothetical protein
LRLRSLETEHWTYHGLDNLVAGFVLQRDIATPDPPAVELDRAAFEQLASEYAQLVAGVSPASLGGRWLIDTGAVVRKLVLVTDPAVVFGELVERLERGPHGSASAAPTKARDFAGDDRVERVASI